MKRIIKFLCVTLFVFSIFSENVSAASACSSKEQVDLRAKAGNVQIKYEVITEDKSTENIEDVTKLVEISIFNITEDIYVKVTNNINNDEKTLNFSDTNDGVVKIRWEDLEEVANFTFQIYSSNKTNCPNEKYKTSYLTIPRYNEYYNIGACEDSKDFYMCQEFVTFKKVDMDEFLDKVRSFRTGTIDESGNDIDKDEELKWSDKIFNFIDDHKLVIGGGLILLVGGFLVIYRIKTKKQRELGL